MGEPAKLVVYQILLKSNSSRFFFVNSYVTNWNTDAKFLQITFTRFCGISWNANINLQLSGFLNAQSKSSLIKKGFIYSGQNMIQQFWLLPCSTLHQTGFDTASQQRRRHPLPSQQQALVKCRSVFNLGQTQRQDRTKLLTVHLNIDFSEEENLVKKKPVLVGILRTRNLSYRELFLRRLQQGSLPVQDQIWRRVWSRARRYIAIRTEYC